MLIKQNIFKAASDDEEQDEDEPDNETYRNKDDFKFDEFDLKRLRHIGLFKAYLEFYNSLPELFKYSTQFQVIPLSVCCDLQQQSTSMYVQSIIQQQHQNYQQTSSSSNYSNYFSSGFGTGWSDLDIDFKLSLLKTQAFNTFSISKRFFMSPSHNYYLNMNQQQNNPLRPKSLTGFGPAAYEEKYLKENLLASFIQADSKCLPAANSFNQLRKPQFYSPLFILAPSTITSTAIALAASNLFFKNAEAGLGNYIKRIYLFIENINKKDNHAELSNATSSLPVDCPNLNQGLFFCLCKDMLNRWF